MNAIQMTQDEFNAAYPLLPNHLNPDASWRTQDGAGCLFETYGAELAFIQAHDSQTVWTVLEEDGVLWVESGRRFVNRLGYLISTVPVPAGQSIIVRDV